MQNRNFLCKHHVHIWNHIRKTRVLKGFNRWTQINFQCTMLWINCKRWIQFSQIFFSPCSYHAVQAWVAILATSVALHSTPVSLSVGRSLRLAELWGLQSCCFFSLTSFTYFTHVRAYPCPKTSLLCWVYKSINLILVPQLWQLLLEAESSFLFRICRALEFLLNFVYTTVDLHFFCIFVQFACLLVNYTPNRWEIWLQCFRVGLTLLNNVWSGFP